MRIFVTGAAGFVGGYLVAALRRSGWDVHSADRDVDVTNRSSVSAAFRAAQPDAVVHLAAQSSVATSIDSPLESFRVNFLGSLNVLSATRAEAPRARVLLVGSADCYGTQPKSGSIDEQRPLRPESPYARSKTAAELLGADAAAHGLDVVRVRAFTHTGPGQTDRFVASSFARQIAEITEGRREPRMRVGNLDSVRDFLDVRDVVDAYLRLLDRRVPADVYNVASGHGVSIRTLLEELESIANVKPAVEIDPARLRPADRSVGDAGRLRAATGWVPQIPLRQTLFELFEFWRDQPRAPAPTATA